MSDFVLAQFLQFVNIICANACTQARGPGVGAGPRARSRRGGTGDHVNTLTPAARIITPTMSMSQHADNALTLPICVNFPTQCHVFDAQLTERSVTYRAVSM